MRIDGPWLRHPATQSVCAALTSRGYQALFVGGCVRNALLEAPVADVDIATDALPLQVVEAVTAAGLRAVPTGIDHGTVTVVAEGLPHEVTTFRRDEETDGRHARVGFSDDVSEDAARRDFTMNALYATPEGEVIDPLGGLPDLRARCVRFVGEADARIREDYLRILRFFRFHAWYGDPAAGMDAEALAACAALGAGIDRLSRERVGAEMRKLLGAPDPAPSVAAMAQAGVLARVLPGAEARALPVLVHLEAGRTPDWLRRLSVLGGEDAGAALRLSRSEERDLTQLRTALGTAAGAAELGYRLGAARGADAVLGRAASMEAPLPPNWEAEVARGASARLPVTARDLMPGLSGPALGARLRELEARWIASDFRLGRDELMS